MSCLPSCLPFGLQCGSNSAADHFEVVSTKRLGDEQEERLWSRIAQGSRIVFADNGVEEEVVTWIGQRLPASCYLLRLVLHP